MISFRKKIDYQRLKEIVQLLVKYEFDNVVGELELKGSRWGDLLYKYDSSVDLDATSPERLRMVFEELGPTFIKLGQMMSTRPDLVGPQMAQEFTRLQDDTLPFDFDTVKIIVEGELGQPLNELFQSFEEKQLAAASIGQVHRAILKDGTLVAVKVQRPGIQDTVEKDLIIMHHLADLINQKIPTLRVFNIPQVVDEFEKSIRKEMDYGLEARNTQNFQANFAQDDGVRAPVVFLDYSTSLVLTMEFIQGTKMSQVMENPHGFDPELLAERVAKSYFQQLLLDGFFHADPHPGNLYVLEDNVVCYLDFGMMGHIDHDFMQNLGELFVQVIDYKVDAIINQLIYMEIITDSVDRNVLKRDIMDILDRYYGASLSDIHLGHILSELALPLITKYQARVPPEFTLIARAVTLIEEVAYSLDNQFDATAQFKPMVKKLLLQKFTPKNMADLFMDNLFEMEHLVKNLPQNINRLVAKVENGEIRVRYSEELSKDIERTSNKLVVAIIIAALLVGSSWIIQIDKGPMVWDMPILGFLGFAASGVLGVGLVIYILRYRKI
ncbi:AarF/ABC1/UbiB kinase family protein [Methanobacterium sp. BAmetb5]|uniref:ABC1 kinase family protein n=1 Tax=Methanobacterium sp. BAmetb5 TaxID=2025351 RepID=UPI000E8DC1EC|nr:AarF/ABC1/UbiB kinase family protein [Methanobacterium sp. BAmetb5]AXV40170.1 MAG: protein kinase [Methanobacterium sp. BAmetb5]